MQERYIFLNGRIFAQIVLNGNNNSTRKFY
jgi:hypothetical protein